MGILSFIHKRDDPRYDNTENNVFFCIGYRKNSERILEEIREPPEWVCRSGEDALCWHGRDRGGRMGGDRVALW